jgi:hypothetical protein
MGLRPSSFSPLPGTTISTDGLMLRCINRPAESEILAALGNTRRHDCQSMTNKPISAPLAPGLLSPCRVEVTGKELVLELELV